MQGRSSLFASLVTVCLLAMAPLALASDPVKNIEDQAVPALKDGTRMTPEAVEKAILDACAHRKFQAAVIEPGLITARWVHGSHSFEVAIPYNESTYSIRYQSSERMDYNPARNRIADAYNDYVAGLAEHIDARLDDTLDRIKKSLKPAKRVARINPRTAV